MALNTAHSYSFNRLSLLVVALLAVFVGLWPRPVLAQDPAQQILDSINAARAENGLGPLAVNPMLNQAAQNHVNDMITNYVYGHYGSDGSSVQTRVARTGYSATPWVSENWVSSGSPAGAMRWWMGDYIHRVNILTARWVEIGVGVGSRGSEMIFVTVFSAGGGNSPSQAAAIAAAAPPPQQQAAPPPSVRIEQVVVPAEGLDYTVRSGDTLLAIGLRYAMPWERIADANGLNERSLLQIGQVIRVPGSGPITPPRPEVKTEEYTVQPNDTLFSIAARRGMYWDEVAVVNGFNEKTILQIGQVIQVPVIEVPEPIVTTPLVDDRRDGIGPVMPQQSPNSFASYSLKQFDPTKGDSMDASIMMAQTIEPSAGELSTGIGGPIDSNVQVDVQIAMAKSSDGPGASAVVLSQHNPLPVEPSSVEANVAESSVAESNIAESSVGEPSAAEASPEVVVAAAAVAEPEAPTLYTVQSGDTIISIAVRHGLDWDAIMAMNGLNENSLLQPGQLLRLR